MILESTRECCDDQFGFTISADFLYWRSEADNFSYGLDIVDVATSRVKFLPIDYDWEPGFRVGLEWNTDYDEWDLLASWTYLRSTSSDTTRDASIIAYLIPDGNNDEVNYARARSRFNYNTVDLELTRSFYVSRALSIRPYMGPRAGFLKEKFNVDYDNSTNPSVPVPSYETFESKYWGVGPRMGLMTDWHFCDGFSFFGNFSTSLLYGEAKSTAFFTETNAGVLETAQDSRNKFPLLTPTVQLVMGAKLETCFYQDWYGFELSVAWETNYWWNQLHARAANAFLPLGALTLKGLTVHAAFNF